MPKQKQPSTQLPVSIQLIEQRIYVNRGHKVMLDSDLATLYEVLTKVLNQAVRRKLAKLLITNNSIRSQFLNILALIKRPFTSAFL
jgi:hypothetical protein